MKNFVSTAKKNPLLRPVFAVAALALVLVGCSGTTTSAPSSDTSSSSSADAMMQQDGNGAMSSSSSAAMMMDSSSSTAAMMGSSSSTAAMMQSGMYKDGTYTADGAYRSPAGGETVSVSLTLKGDVVADATFTGHATNPRSTMMQNAFEGGFKEYVVGKKLDEVSVGVINGSSLTGAGFMDAVTKIKTEAKA